MAQSSPSLSLDEFALIIEAIDERRDLSSMCLAHSSFVSLCQARIFSQIRIVYPSARASRVSTFLEIQKASPHLSNFIRNLDVKLSAKRAAEGVNHPENAMVVRFLDLLRNLRYLGVDKGSEWDARYNWKQLDPQICDAILRLISSPDIVSLQICGLQNFPLSGLLGLKYASRLKKLIFDLEGIEPHPSLENIHATDTQLATLPQVTNLVAFGNSSPALEILWGRAMSPYGNSPVVDFTQLRKLYTVWYDDFTVNSTKTIINNAISLEHLTCILPEGSSTFYHGLSESILAGPSQTLAGLKLSLMTKDLNDSIAKDSPFQSVSAQLSQLARNTPHLKLVVLEFFYDTETFYGPIDLLGMVIQQKCMALDRLLADLVAFPAIHRIWLHFHILSSDEAFTALDADLNDLISRIRQRCFPNASIMRDTTGARLVLDVVVQWTESTRSYVNRASVR